MIPQFLPPTAPLTNPASLTPAILVPRLVLDTNVCLDLFVFRDPRWAILLNALETGRLSAVTRADCKMEWQIVLRYPHLGLDDAAQAACHAAFEALITCHDFPSAYGIQLPRCSDRDDQKFLELARDAKASILLTKDKALLKLARKTQQAGLFRIMLPQTWVAEQEKIEA